MAVKLYSTNWCTYCKLVRDFFRENKVKFKDVNVQRNQKAAQEMEKKTGQSGIPVIDINGAIIIGFDIEKLRKCLKIEK
jgi:glutaredoxin 3